MSKIMSIADQVVNILDEEMNLLENEHEENVSYSQIVKSIMQKSGVWKSNEIVKRAKRTYSGLRG
jgi:hypothetical protein